MLPSVHLPKMALLVVMTSCTSTEQAALFPFCADAFMVQLPLCKAVTTPFCTSATVLLVEDHATVGFVAFAGRTVDTSILLSPTFRERLVLFMVTLCWFSTGSTTVSVMSAPVSVS